MKSVAVAVLLLAAVAACAQKPVEPAPVAIASPPVTGGFLPYCGPVWSVGRQGYVNIPCPPGTPYEIPW